MTLTGFVGIIIIISGIVAKGGVINRYMRHVKIVGSVVMVEWKHG